MRIEAIMNSVALCLLVGCAQENDIESIAEASSVATAEDGALFRAGPTDNMSSCGWVRASNGSDLNVTCPAAKTPIAGGCRTVTGGQIRDMHPYEANSTGNLIEYGDYWYDLAGDNGGWRCSWDTSSVDNFVVALCCGT